ncbi:MAG: haloacid dehalogenase-like hydrolase [Anaerovibrio sp.]|nr:haloacid dehalogenase-like hydrolase [Anaerovibrio sp.]
MRFGKACSTLVAVMIGIGSMVGVQNTEAVSRTELAKISVNANGSNFKYWNKEAAAYKQLTGYVKDVTNPKSKNFIPVEDRIAVFDLDGTILCETTPSYFEWMMHIHRALNDPSYTPTEKDRADAEQVKNAVEHIGVPVPNSGQAQAQAAVFAGMTLPEYDAYVRAFMETPAEGLSNLKRGESFYMPIVEVVSYLNANKFKVFVVSGSDRQAVRVLVSDIMPVDSDNIIGTDVEYFASHQAGADGLAYTYKPGDEVVRGEFILKDLQMNKVSNIVREIGKQPVLAFGNSTSDSSMLNYTINDNKYKALAFGLLCDDLVRERGNLKSAEKMRAACEKYGWTTISMRDDFKTIYGDNVRRTD